MRFMIIVKASTDSAAGVMPPAALLAEMGAFHEELARSRRLPNPTLHGSACEIEVRQLFEAEDFAPPPRGAPAC